MFCCIEEIHFRHLYMFPFPFCDIYFSAFPVSTSIQQWNKQWSPCIEYALTTEKIKKGQFLRVQCMYRLDAQESRPHSFPRPFILAFFKSSRSSTLLTLAMRTQPSPGNASAMHVSTSATQSHDHEYGLSLRILSECTYILHCAQDTPILLSFLYILRQGLLT